MLDHKQISGFLLTLVKGLPTFAPNIKDPEVVAIWHHALKGFDFDALSTVGMQLMLTEKQFPPIVRILELLNISKNGSDTFEDLVKLVSAHGAYHPPGNLSYVMATIINRMGGWIKLCNWSNEELPFRKREFDEIKHAVLDMMAITDVNSLPPQAIDGIHRIIESNPSTKTSTPLIKSEKAIPGELPTKQIDWKAITDANPDIDLNLPSRLLEKGFFRKDSKPGFYYRYCFGQVPGKGWPHAFVAVDQHLEAVKEKQERAPAFGEKNQFDPSKYEVNSGSFND